jgi:regulator of replication initiation timing
MFNKHIYETISELTDAIYLLTESISAMKEDIAELTTELLDD